MPEERLRFRLQLYYCRERRSAKLWMIVGLVVRYIWSPDYVCIALEAPWPMWEVIPKRVSLAYVFLGLGRSRLAC